MLRRLAFAVSFTFALAALAQQKPAASETIEVQLTNVDVVVTDADGNRVTGLAQTEFEVLENGSWREITNFSEIRRDGAVTVQPAPRRILVAIDNRTIPHSARKKTIAALRQTLEPLLTNGTDRLMVVTISGSSKPRTAWTSDRAEIERALAEVEREPAQSRMNLAEIDNMFGEMVSVASGLGPKPRGPTRTRNSGSRGNNQPLPPVDEEETGRRQTPEVDFNTILMQTRAHASGIAAETQQTLNALNASLGQFATVPGGKRLVLLVGGALPVFPGSDVFERLEAARRDIERFQRSTGTGRGRQQQIGSVMMEKTSFDMSRHLDALATSARLKGIAFYAVNPELRDRTSKDASAQRSAGSALEFASANSDIDGFERLAHATGGASHVGRPAELALSEVRSDLDSYYSLAYRSSGPVKPDTKIEVRVKSGHKTRATIASAAVSSEWQVADQVLIHHMSEPATNDLGISLNADRAYVADDARRVTVRVMIPFDRLQVVKDGRDYICSFSVFVSVGEAAGGGEPKQETRNFRWNEQTVQNLRGKSIAYGVNLTVGPGRDRVSIGMLDLLGGKTGYARMILQ